jgi:hypothetical protein
MVDYLFVHSKSPAKTFKNSPILWQIKQPSRQGVFFLAWIHRTSNVTIQTTQKNYHYAFFSSSEVEN